MADNIQLSAAVIIPVVEEARPLGMVLGGISSKVQVSEVALLKSNYHLVGSSTVSAQENIFPRIGYRLGPARDDVSADQATSKLNVAICLWNNTDNVTVNEVVSGMPRTVLLEAKDRIAVREIVTLDTGLGLPAVRDDISVKESIKILGFSVNRDPIRNNIRIQESYPLVWGGVADKDWFEIAEYRGTGLTLQAIRDTGLVFERVAVVYDGVLPILDPVWYRSQTRAKFSAGFQSAGIKDSWSQGFLVWTPNSSTTVKVTLLRTQELRSYWSKEATGLSSSTHYWVCAFVVDPLGNLILSNPLTFKTRSGPKLYDLVVPYVKYEDAQLGGDLNSYLEVLQLTIDQAELSLAETLSYRNVEEIPEELLSYLASNIGADINRYLSWDENRLAIKEFTPWVNIKGSELSFEVIFNRMGMAVGIANQVLKIIIPSFQGHLSYEDAYIMDQFYHHEGSLDIQAFWWGNVDYPDTSRIWEELKKVWPAGFLLWLTIRIAIGTEQYDNWCDIKDTLGLTKNFTYKLPFWERYLEAKCNMTRYFGWRRDMVQRYGKAIPAANSNHFTTMSDLDASTKDALNASNNAKKDRAIARSPEPIQYRSSIKIVPRPNEDPEGIDNPGYCVSGYIENRDDYVFDIPLPIFEFEVTRWNSSVWGQRPEIGFGSSIDGGDSTSIPYTTDYDSGSSDSVADNFLDGGRSHG